MSSAKAVQKRLYTELFPTELSKSQKRRMEILEGAIKAYAEVDFNHVSFDDIALPAKTSRRLVQHYFPDKGELFSVTMKLIRAKYQSAAITALSAATDPSEQLTEYVRAAVRWTQTDPLHFRNWILYYLVCAQQIKLRRLHEEMADVGAERIEALIRSVRTDVDIQQEDLHFAAKTIQRLITGALIETSSERTSPDTTKIQNEVIRASLMIAMGI